MTYHMPCGGNCTLQSNDAIFREECVQGESGLLRDDVHEIGEVVDVDPPQESIDFGEVLSILTGKPHGVCDAEQYIVGVGEDSLMIALNGALAR